MSTTPRTILYRTVGVSAVAAAAMAGAVGSLRGEVKSLPPSLQDSTRPDGAGPNEPGGLRPLGRATFDSKLPEGWSKRPQDAIELLPDPRAPFSPPGIARAYFRPGFLGGRGPVRVDWNSQDRLRKLYVSFWIRLSDGWQGHPSGVNKILHFWINNGNKVYLSAQGAGAGPYIPQVRLQGIAERPVSRNLSPRLSGARLRRGEWYRWEVLLVANSPGNSDGVVKWWINGRPAGSADHIAFVGPDGRNQWTAVSWNPTWGGMGSQVGVLQWMDMDDIYVSGGE